jgi:hypothetical protein
VPGFKLVGFTVTANFSGEAPLAGVTVNHPGNGEDPEAWTAAPNVALLLAEEGKLAVTVLVPGFVAVSGVFT